MTSMNRTAHRPAQAPLGVILAGGRATRMGGGDKGRLDLNGRSLVDHVIARLAPQVQAIALNANGTPHRFADLGLPIIADSHGTHAGPLAGILAGLDWGAEQGAETILTVAVDTPFFPLDFAQRMQQAARYRHPPLILAATREPATTGRQIRRHPVFGLWPTALRHDLRASLKQGVRKVVIWADRHDAGTVVFDTQGGDPFFNINRPQDLHLARAMIERA